MELTGFLSNSVVRCVEICHNFTTDLVSYLDPIDTGFINLSFILVYLINLFPAYELKLPCILSGSSSVIIGFKLGRTTWDLRPSSSLLRTLRSEFL